MKKIISVILCAALLFAFSSTAFAGEGDSGSFNVEEVLSSLSDMLNESFSNISEDTGEILQNLSENSDEYLDAISESSNNILQCLSGLAASISDFFADAADESDVFWEDLKESIDERKEEIAGAVASSTITGGWSIPEEFSTSLTEEETGLFAAALEGLLGVDYIPVALLGKQVVSGTNYAFLSLGNTVTAEPAAGWYIITVYEDLEGAVSLLSIREIDLTDIDFISEVNKELVGGWKLTTPDPVTLREDAQAAFDSAIRDYEAVSFAPIALLGTQAVAGTNYKILCNGTIGTENPISSLFVIDIYENLEGETQILNASLFDLAAYIGA